MSSIYRELATAFLKVGLLGFGGGYAMLHLLRQDFVITKGWLGSAEFLDLVAISQATPGPIAINAATFLGYRLGEFWGALVATGSVLVAPLIVVLTGAWLWQRYQEVGWWKRVFFGLRPAVVALIASAAWAMAGDAFPDLFSVAIGIAAFGLGASRKLSPVAIMLLAAGAGIVSGLWFGPNA